MSDNKQAKSHAAVAEVVERPSLIGMTPSQADAVMDAYIDRLLAALTHATLAKEAADASVGRLMDETQRMAKLYDAMEDRAEAAEKEAGRLQTDAQILHEIAIALESRGYIHMCNGGSISSLLDEMLVVEKQLSAFYSEGGLNRLTQCQDALSRAEQRTAAMEASSMEMRRVLELLDSLGGLGHDKHAWIRDALAAQSAGGGG